MTEQKLTFNFQIPTTGEPPADVVKSTKPVIHVQPTQQPTVQKPSINVEKAEKKPKIDFRTQNGNKLNIQHQQVQQPPKEPKLPSIDVQKPQKSSSEVDLKTTVTQMSRIQEYLDQARNSGSNKFSRHSIGYISLINFIKDPTAKADSRTDMINSGKASLVVKNENRYVPPHLIKKADLWEDDSNEAFEYSTYLSLNRITEDKIENTAKEIVDHTRNDDNRKFVAKCMVEKATLEPAFTILYAKLTKLLNEKTEDGPSDQMIVNEIIFNVEKSIIDFISNPPATDSEADLATGYMNFAAALISCKVISFKSGLTTLKSLVNKLLETLQSTTESTRKVAVPLVVMLEAFVRKSGPEFFFFTKDQKLWQDYEQLKQYVPESTLMGCLLMNIDEDRETWLKQGESAITETKTAKSVSEDKLSSVEVEAELRNLFCDYLDRKDTQNPLGRLTFDVFLEAAIQHIVDYIKDRLDYSVFVASSLSRAPTNDLSIVTKALKNFTQEIKDQDLKKDYPLIWNTFFTMIVALHGFGLLKDPEEIVADFPYESAKVNWANEVKFLLYEVHFFQKSSPRGPTKEITDALQMPDLIDSRNENSPLSRITAVAVCRVVVNKVYGKRPEDAEKIIKRYRAQLRKIYERFREVFRYEFDTEDLPFSFDDVVRMI